MGRKHPVPDVPARARSAGMTLLEVLVAIIIVGAGVSVFLALFATGTLLGNAARSKSAGAECAEEQLQTILRDLSAYDWSQLKTMPVGELAEIKVRGQEAAVGSACGLPSVMPGDSRSFRREKTFHQRFTWQALARIPDREAAYVELTVVVRWQLKNGESLFALTSAVPRAAVETVL